MDTTASPDQLYYDTSEWGIEHPYHREVLADILMALPGEAHRILDVGCGDGLITNRLPQDRHVVGMDISSVALKHVQREKREGSILEIPYADHEFDLVMANDVLEHLGTKELRRAGTEIQRVAKSYILVTVPFSEVLDARREFSFTTCDWPHLNRHQQSFSLERLRSLFDDFEMKIAVFSGVKWEDELYPIERVKALIKAVDSSPFSSSRRERVTERLSRELHELRKRQAAFLSENPYEIDLLERRTEIICLYVRSGCQDPLAEVRQRLMERAVSVASNQNTLEISRRQIDFFNLDWYRSPHLPLYSKLPYFHTDCETRKTDEGCLFRSDTAPNTLKVGFFCPILPETALKICGVAPNAGTLSIKHFDGDSNYLAVKTDELSAGPFEITIEDFLVEYSPYGMLFELQFTDLELTIERISLEGEAAYSELLNYLPERREYIHRRLDGTDTFVSTRIYSDPLVIPNWFLEADWLSYCESQPLFSDEKSLFIALQKFGLDRSDPQVKSLRSTLRRQSGSKRLTLEDVAVIAATEVDILRRTTELNDDGVRGELRDLIARTESGLSEQIARTAEQLRTLVEERLKG
ncbi:MAG: hypothetical protein RLZ98_3395, partial [Pseudomonadota bacterium]